MATTPRIRPDLKAEPTEDQGIKYFDVSDPKSGARMRMYDFEWLVAERMDGKRGYDEVASWARERLGISPRPDDIEAYALKLRELGFFEAEPEAGGDTLAEDRTPLPPPVPGAPLSSARDADEIETAPKPKVEELALPVVEAKPQPKPEPIVAPAPKPEPVAAPAPKPEPIAAPVPAPAPAPVAAKPEPQRPVEQPHEETGKVVAAQSAPAPKKGSGGWVVLLILALAGIGGVAYLQYGAPEGRKVTVTLATPREVVRLFDGGGTVRKSESTVLAFGEAGKVSDVVAKGTEAKPGMALATLETYAKIEKDLADVRDRLAYYEKQLAAAKAKEPEGEATKKAEAKVAEKKKLLETLEARAGKARLVAPASGLVAEVLIQPGDEVRPGAAAIKLGETHLSLELKVPEDEAPKAGDTVTLQASAGVTPVQGRVTRSEAGTVTIELLDDTVAKPGDQLRLVKKKEQNVVPLPAAAVVQRDGADVVFVLANGEAHLRKVTVADRTGAEVLIADGLAPGDSVITSDVDELVEGQQVSAE